MKPRFSESLILGWADEYFAAHRRWPTVRSGSLDNIPGGEGFSWNSVHDALQEGRHGLPGGSSLAKLLALRRGRRPHSWKPDLTFKQILAWADAHRRRAGDWPTKLSGSVVDDRNRTTWCGVNDALKRGGRGLPGDSSLPLLLAQNRGRRHRQLQPPLTGDTILSWADAHHRRTGRWPDMNSGPVRGVPGVTWLSIDGALRFGRRGLPGSSSLPRFLAAQRDRPYRERGGLITERRIIHWARSFHARTGAWPQRRTPRGPLGSPQESWLNLDSALRYGHRGLPGGTSLLMLLARRCGARHMKALPPITITQILAWADAHHRRSGDWPTQVSGQIHGVPGETWGSIDGAIRAGRRGLPGGSSLVRILARRRGRPLRQVGSSLTTGTVLAWADAHHQRIGRWPTLHSGLIIDAPSHESWGSVNAALVHGYRGLSGGVSLIKLLAKHRGKFDMRDQPRLSVAKILRWADDHRRRTGHWATQYSGPVAGQPHEDWNNVNFALLFGRRGLPRHLTIHRLLVKHRGKFDRLHPPRLSIRQILRWADACYQRTGDWPSRLSGGVPDAPGETWLAITLALTRGKRGLAGGSSLVRLLARHRMPMYARKGIPLKRSEILDWAAAHHELTGKRPTADSGPVRDVPGETWAAVDASLRTGSRGLRGTVSLAEFLDEHEVPAFHRIGTRLTERRIIRWAVSFKQRVGRWPTAKSAYTDPSRTEKWSTIDIALREGLRGLRGGSSLAKLLSAHRKTLRPR